MTKRTFKTLAAISIICSFILLLSWIMTKTNYIPSFISTDSAKSTYFAIMVFLTFVSAITFIVVTEILIMSKTEEHHYRRKFGKVSQELTTDFKPVKIKPSAISKLVANGDIVAYAKLDENNNVVYKLEILSQGTIYNTKFFVNNFDVL